MEVFISPVVWAEYRDVLFRPKFAALRTRAEAMLDALASLAIEIAPTETVAIATDEDDNRFLECALAAEADYLITGNLRHFPATCGTTRIVNARQFFTERNSVCGTVSPAKITETG